MNAVLAGSRPRWVATLIVSSFRVGTRQKLPG
jgi:hypothetical protein